MNIASPDGRDARLAGVRASADKWRRKIAVVMKWKTMWWRGRTGVLGERQGRQAGQETACMLDMSRRRFGAGHKLGR